MKRALILFSALLGILLLWKFLPVTTKPKHRPSVTEVPTPAPGQIEQSAPVPASPHPLAKTFGSTNTNTPPEQEPARLLEILQAYRRATGSFPTAEDNPSLMRKLTQPDSEGRQLFPATHPRLNREGALVDAWGTPFFFHHLSSMDLEIRSAGPDRELYTTDDLVVSKSSIP